MDNMKVNEVVTNNEDGSYTIFINNNLCEEKREKALQHALSHIGNDDFSKYNVQSIELNAHEMC